MICPNFHLSDHSRYYSAIDPESGACRDCGHQVGAAIRLVHNRDHVDLYTGKTWGDDYSA